MKSARFAVVMSLFISFSVFGLVEKVSASSPLSIHIANNNLYIDSCSLNLPVVTGYKGYVGTEEIYSTGPSGGFPCYSGDLFIQNLSSFYYLNTSSPFTSHFDFYANPDFNSPIIKTFSLEYSGSGFSVFDDSTRVVSFGVSTSTKTVSVQNYISQNEVGSTVNFTISSSSPENIIFNSDPVLATTTGNFFYSWSYPDLQAGNDYIFTTNIASTTVLKSTSTVVSLPAPLSGNSNVLFIPGLEASRLYQKKTVLGIPVEDQLWEPNGNSDVLDLYLNSDGDSIGQGIYTKDIIKETNVPVNASFAGQNLYKSFSEMMDGLVHDNNIAAWQSYAYDWRQGVQDIVDNGTKYENDSHKLVEVLETLVDSSKSGKVTIIAHSNGGLITKAFIKKLEDDKTAGRNNLIDKIDTVILVASPQLGTPTAIPALLHGYDQDLGFGLLLDNPIARELGRNMDSAYGLLPSAEYFNHVSNPVISFSQNLFDPYMTNEIATYGTDISSYVKQKSFMLGTDGRTNPITLDTLKPIIANSGMFAKAESLHSSIDTMTFPSSIRVIQIAGWGLDTVAGFQYEANKICSYTTDLGCTGRYIIDEKPIFTVDGDKTVVTPSALAMNGENYYVNLPRHNGQLALLRRNRQHKDILEVAEVDNLINSVIMKQNITVLPNVLSTTLPIGTSNKLRLSVHSPVTLDAYDLDGNHTGKVCSSVTGLCYVQENIPNSSYYEFGEGKYLNLSQEDLQKVKLQGTDTGTFTFESQLVSTNGQTTTSSFIDIPVTTQTQAEITVDQNTGAPQLKLDVTGDGVIDFTLAPSTAFDPIIYLQIFKITVDSLDITNTQKKSFDTKIDNIIKLIQKGKVDKAKITADKFASALQKSVSAKGPKNPKPHQLSKTDAQLLLDMLNTLLDNIG